MTPVIEIKAEQFQQYLSVLRKRMSNLEPFFRDIGNLIENQSRRSFDLESAPSGDKWKPSRRKIKRGGKTLTESGALVGSLNYKYGKNATGYFAEVGANRSYAAMHQFGGRYSIKVSAHRRMWKHRPVYVKAHTRNVNMPKRAYLPENQAEIKWQQVQELFTHYMKLSEGG